MELTDLINQVDDFDQAAPREKIRLFAWYLHAYKEKEIFDGADIRACFFELHMADPHVAKYLSRMVEYRDLMKVRGGFKLERAVRTALNAKYGSHHSVVQVGKLLSDLPGKVADLAEKNFLAEAIKCYRIKAYRACIIMTWNLAYSHLLHWVLTDAERLDEFNATIPRRYPKKSSIRIAAYNDFLEELKESEVIELGNTAKLINSNVARILKEKLGRRNMAAHPTGIVIVQSQADDVVTDLVNNVVLSMN